MLLSSFVVSGHQVTIYQDRISYIHNGFEESVGWPFDLPPSTVDASSDGTALSVSNGQHSLVVELGKAGAAKTVEGLWFLKESSRDFALFPSAAQVRVPGGMKRVEVRGGWNDGASLWGTSASGLVVFKPEGSGWRAVVETSEGSDISEQSFTQTIDDSHFFGCGNSAGTGMSVYHFDGKKTAVIKLELPVSNTSFTGLAWSWINNDGGNYVLHGGEYLGATFVREATWILKKNKQGSWSAKLQNHFSRPLKMSTSDFAEKSIGFVEQGGVDGEAGRAGVFL